MALSSKVYYDDFSYISYSIIHVSPSAAEAASPALIKRSSDFLNEFYAQDVTFISCSSCHLHEKKAVADDASSSSSFASHE